MSFKDYLKEIEEKVQDKRITSTYETWDEESLEAGETDNKGWEDEEGQSMIPDEYDKEEGITVVDNTVKFLKNKGATQPSSSFFHTRIWYDTADDDVDIRTGDRTTRSYFLNGFTSEEEQEIFNRIRGK